MSKFLEKIKSNKVKAITLASTGLTTLMCAPVFAEGSSDSASVITGITDGLTAGKADFVTALAAISGVAIGFFVIKFVVKQAIKYFSTIANKG